MTARWPAALVAALLSALSICSAGAADGGLYIGAGVGQGSIKDDTSNPNGAGTINFNSDDAAYKAFIGYRFTGIPLVDLAAEAGYIAFGKPSQTSLGQNVQYKLHGANAAGLVIFPLGPLDLYGKAGVLSWSSEKNIGGTASSKSGTKML